MLSPLLILKVKLGILLLPQRSLLLHLVPNCYGNHPRNWLPNYLALGADGAWHLIPRTTQNKVVVLFGNTNFLRICSLWLSTEWASKNIQLLVFNWWGYTAYVISQLSDSRWGIWASNYPHWETEGAVLRENKQVCEHFPCLWDTDGSWHIPSD